MEIDFNTRRLSKADTGKPVATRPAAGSAGETASFSATQALEQKLKELSTVRPEKVAHAKEIVGDTHFPPPELVDRIASLLAMHVKL
jgi:hypothetical protein